MPVVFSQDTTGVSTLQKIVNALHTNLTTIAGVPWVLESAYFPGITGDPNTVPFPTTAAPVDPVSANGHYCTLVYKIGDFATFTGSPWRVKVKFLNGANVGGVRIEVTTGSALSGTANGSGATVADPGTMMALINDLASGPKTMSEWFVNAYESGFSIIFMPSASVNNCMINVERARNLLAVKNDSIIVVLTGDSAAGGATTIGFAPFIADTGSLSKKMPCRARRFPPGTEHAPDDAMILRSADPNTGTTSMAASAVVYDPTGAATPAGSTLGPFPVSAGVHGTPRLFVCLPYADYVAGNSIAITHDGVGRNIRIPSSFSSTTYYVYCPLKD